LKSNFPKTLPPSRCQPPPRQRNPPPINRGARHAHPYLHHRRNFSRHHLRRPRRPGPQQRSVHRQHPTNRPQYPRRLRGRQQQLHHLRLSQNHLQLAAIPRRPIRHQPHQPAKPPRQSPRRHSPQPPVRLHSFGTRRARGNPPEPASLKPLCQPLHLPADPAQPLMQQQNQPRPQQSPAAHRSAQTAQNDRQVQKRGIGCGMAHPPVNTTPTGWTQQKNDRRRPRTSRPWASPRVLSFAPIPAASIVNKCLRGLRKILSDQMLVEPIGVSSLHRSTFGCSPDLPPSSRTTLLRPAAFAR